MRIFVLAVPVLAAVLFTGCYNTEVETVDIVTTIPWPDHEQSDYVLLDRDDQDEVLGEGSLIVDRTNDQYEFQINFTSDAGETDETSLLVDAMTLRPEFVHRERDLEDETTLHEGVYKPEEEEVSIITVIDGEERSVPLRLDKEHYYDNESSLFLWRTVPFEEDYEASYHAVLVNTRQIDVVTLRVVAQEEVTVPAGTFDTWRVELRLEGGVRQAAWFADTPDRRLVQYDNSRQVFQLTAYSGG